MKLSNPLKYAIATILAGTLILFLVIYVEQKTRAVSNENTPLLALAEHIKNKSQSAHIWFEKAMRRDKNTVFEKDIYASLDSTVQLFKKVLEGGETELGVFHKTTNIKINNTLKQLLINSEEIKQLAQQRMLLIIKSTTKKRKGKAAKKVVLEKGEEVGGALDQEFDASYEKLQGNYEGLATLVKMKIVQDSDVLNNLFWLSVILIIVIFGFFSFLLYKISNNERLAGRALMLSEKRFRTIFEEAPLGIALIEPATGIIHEINPKYSAIIGRSKEEMNNIDWMAITHPEDLKEGIAQKALMSEHKLKSFKMSKRYVHADGSTIWGDVSVASVETGDKSKYLQLCMVEDVTARKKAEKEIIKSQYDFEDAQKLAKIGSWEFNLITYELVWSKELYRIFELEGHAMTGLYESYRNKFHPDDLILLDNVTKTAIQKGIGYSFEHRIFDNDKNIIYLSCIGEVIKNDDGELIALKGTCQDITARKKMETLLKNTEQNALLVRHAAQVPGTVYQYQIYPDGRFVFPFVSEGVMDLCELSAEEVMLDGAKLFNCVHPDDLEGLMVSINESLKTFNNWNYEYRVNLPVKGIRWLRGNSKPERLPDGSTLWHGYLIDVTESKEAKEALQISKDKQEAVFNGSNDAIMLLTRKGFFDCNPKTLEMFGMHERKEFIESHPAEASPALQPDGQDSLTKANAMIEIAYEKGINRFEWLHKRKNGELFPAEVLLSAFNYGNERVLQATVHDITERKLAENKLDEQKDFYEKILNTLPLEIAVFDSEHRYLFLNPAAIKNEEFRKYIIGKDDFEYCEYRQRDPAIAQERRKHFLEVKELKKSVKWEDSLIDDHGKSFSNLRGMVPLYNDTGELTKIIGFGIDITERKAAEKKLTENEALLATILETLPVAVFCKDVKNDFRYTLWNKKAELIFGVKAENCIGKVDYDLFPKLNADFYRNDDIKTSQILGILDVPEEVLEFDNKKVTVHTRKTIVKDLEGKPRFLLGVSEDITERKKADEKIKKSEEKYRSVVENAVDMIITFDKNCIIQFINHLRPGTPVEQVIGTSIYNFIPVEYQELVKQKIKNVFEGKKSEKYELPGIKLDGSIAWYSSNLGPVFSANEVIGITLMVRDITESKEAEEKIQQSLKEKEILLQEVHHRVKNNLQIILSILNLQHAQISDKKTLDLVRDIRSRIKAMSFIHELLYQTDDFSSINFSEYITSITSNLIYSYTQNQKINLKLDVGTIFLDLDSAIPCGLIINEIVTNALKYAFTEQENGDVHVSLTQKNEFIQLTISDNGKGLPDNIDFRNTESLGMQLVVTLIQQLGGEIVLDNSFGAKYTITFKAINKTESGSTNNKALEIENA